MAEKDQGRKVSVYRSVSFQYLSEWRAKSPADESQHKSKLFTSSAQPPPASLSAGDRSQQQPPPQPTPTPTTTTRSASKIRSVCKLVSANLASPEIKRSHPISPSIRQLSELFDSGESPPPGPHAARPPPPPPPPLGRAAERQQVTAAGGTRQREGGETEVLTEGLAPVLGEEEEEEEEKEEVVEVGGGGDEAPSDVAASPQRRGQGGRRMNLEELRADQHLAADAEHQQQQQQPLASPASPGEAAHWPSVTEMLKLFGEPGSRKPPRLTPDPASSCPWGEPPGEGQAASCPRPEGTCSPVRLAPSRSAANPGPQPPASGEQKPLSWGEAGTLGCRVPPPPPPPRSSLPLALRLPWRSSGLHKQEGRQESDSLHSTHNCSKPQAVPTTTSIQASSSDEEQYSRDLVQHSNPSSSSKVGKISRSQDRSSGSEEDHPMVHRDVKRRSLRKKKASIVVGSKNESDSDDPLGESMARHEGHGQLEHFSCKSEEGLKSQPTAESDSPALDCSSPCGLATLPRESKHCVSAACQTSKVEQSHKRSLGLLGDSGTPSPTNQPHSTSGSPIPMVSRVAKVNIQSFLQSPSSSRSSSRYSSTETLKEEDHYSGLNRNFQGSLNMHRTPSFGHGDEMAKHLKPLVRSRPKLPFGIVKVMTEGSTGSVSPQYECSTDKSKHRKSMSNPDIASETLTLFSFLKSDFSGLRMRRKENDDFDSDGVNHDRFGGTHCQNTKQQHELASVGRGRGSLHSLNQQSAGVRPTLKDLTATLRRAKSFTYSDKPVTRRPIARTLMKPSNSEATLSNIGCCDSASEGESQDTAHQRSEDLLPVDMQVQYIQEAGQLFEKINTMWSQKESPHKPDQKDAECHKRAEEDAKFQKDAEMLAAAADEELENVKRGESEENLSGGKSADDLSGPESSMTDEGIVTEPETGSSSTLYKEIPSHVLVRKPASGLSKENEKELLVNQGMTPAMTAVRTGYESVAIGGNVVYNKTAASVTLDPPSTPSSIRRRRKFPPGGSNGSDSSNGSNGESSGDTYRSFSDPMPHRKCSEETENFSVDSNLLGSLNSVKGGILECSATALSECTGSAASDLSVCSDGLKDYNTVIQRIVREPGTMDKVIDEKGNGKLVKKKSLSDPSRRGELSTPGFTGPSEPITEMEQAIPTSSSEPILSEQRDEVGDLEEFSKQVRKPRSQSERTLPLQVIEEQDKANLQNFSLHPKLAEVLSPRSMRRSSKKRNNRVTQQEGRKYEMLGEMDQSPPLKTRPSTKHIRHTSEPANFVPIASKVIAPETHLSCSQPVHVTAPEPTRQSRKQLPLTQTPSLEDVTKQYILKGESSLQPPVDLSASAPGTPTSTESRIPSLPKPNEELGASINKGKPQVDMRKHVMMTLLDAEQSYVESLRTLIQGYMRPLKQPENSCICDLALVDDMFFQIPEILEHHEKFLEQAHHCVLNWHEKQKVGDLMIETFSKDVLANSYSAYIDNFLNAKEAVRLAKDAKPAFIKFLEQSMRENKEKQALSDLMIKPVQRIPRYELLIKDLLKHTPDDHPDHPCLLAAQRYIKLLAERINKGKKNAEEAEKEARILQEIESHIEGMMDVRIHEELLVPHRKFIRQEMVTEVKTVSSKKERSLFLFTDLLICTTLKRKTGSLRRSSMSLYTAGSVIDTASKYKFLWKLPLEDLDIVKGTAQATNRENIQKTLNRLEEDFSILSQISTLAETLSISHQSLDDVIKDLMASVNRELSEKQSLAVSTMFPLTKIELTATTADGTETFIFEFSSIEARAGFEQAFEETKKKLALNRDHWDPEFLKAIPIMKTRSGMQFSCASPSHGGPDNTHEVWVCNSDGYVGQVCLLSIKPVPTVEACIAVCSARIICIASVPGLSGTSRDRSELLLSPSCVHPHRTSAVSLEEPTSQQPFHISISNSAQSMGELTESGNRSLNPFDSDDTEDDESSPSPSGTLRSQASRSTISSSTGNEEMSSSKDFATETTSSEEEPETDFIANSNVLCQTRNSDSPMDGRAMRRSSRGSFTRASLEELLSIDPEANQSSMWLGTEDGCIHVYQSSDNIRNRKNSMKMQHSAAVMCILYLDNKVFVSLANGELMVYQRDAGSFWDPQNSHTLCLGSPGNPVTKMVQVAGKLWCGCQNRILIINTATLCQEHMIQIGQDSNRCVTSMVSSSLGVWVALQSSAQVKLYHAGTYENLTEVDVAPAVHKMLAGSDAIIRQHKAACLRITALLACKDLLWIGTSAGVVLTLSIPHVTANTTSLRTPLIPMGSAHGHTGHVRFLTAIELPEIFDLTFPPTREPGRPSTGGERLIGSQKRDSARRRSSAIFPLKTNMLVISGGDGYEDFRLTNSSETVGRDDSTNHLLLWRV
ncbi:rho guanine nucleotide exchange factor 17-like [Carcharodon carcharias]|uniref:rho guanine nucleotide exchange factor 17-like n=1 Tax=Carcharodon carcharias TaxID=13397 RepID=UPI001B7DBA50|nr:rho guanine nucleotide exchange factor 17-like [Carcharodon carcharias]